MESVEEITAFCDNLKSEMIKRINSEITYEFNFPDEDKPMKSFKSQFRERQPTGEIYIKIYLGRI